MRARPGKHADRSTKATPSLTGRVASRAGLSVMALALASAPFTVPTAVDATTPTATSPAVGGPAAAAEQGMRTRPTAAQGRAARNTDPRQGPVLYARHTPGPQKTLGTPVPRPAGPADYTFLSTPDFYNCDIADLRRYDPAVAPNRNSWNPAYAQTLDTIFDTFVAEDPNDVLVAGDLVQGHWGIDAQDTGIFGPVSNRTQRRQATRRAADFYLSQWQEKFTERGLTVHAGVGDHDLGDDPWSGSRVADEKRAQANTFKDAFYDNLIAPHGYQSRPAGPAAKTAYATYLSPEVLLVTVDVFYNTGTDVITEVDPQQLAWLDAVLAAGAAADTDWIIVQGHTPVLTPIRKWGSSALTYSGGQDTPFWQTMARHRVDLYLNGEVHDVTVSRADGITQISHGGIVQSGAKSGVGATNYTLGEIFGERMFLRNHRFRPSMVDKSSRLWQTGTARPIVAKTVWDSPGRIGEMVLTSDNEVLFQSGRFLPYSG